jgi:hypothetical protein
MVKKRDKEELQSSLPQLQILTNCKTGKMGCGHNCNHFVLMKENGRMLQGTVTKAGWWW